MKAPGSPSSPLQTMYLHASLWRRTWPHFFPVGKPPPPPAPELGVGDLLDDFVPGHVEQGLFQGGVTANGQVLLQAGGVDMSAVLQHQAGLAVVEGDVGLALVDLAVLAVGQALYQAALDHGLLNDILAVGQLHLGVQVALGLYPHQGAHLTKAVAAAFFQGHALVVGFLLKLYRAGDAPRLHEFLQPGVNLQRTAGDAACAGTDQELFFLPAQAGGVAVAGLAEVFSRIHAHLKALPSARPPGRRRNRRS